jgi:hypothetical protein
MPSTADPLRTVLEHAIDGALHDQRIGTGCHAQHVDADAIGAGGATLFERLLQILVVEEHLLLVKRWRAALVDGLDGEVPRLAIGALEDRAVDRHGLADLPVVLVRKLPADDARGAILRELFVAAFCDRHLRVADQERVVVDAELREEAALVLFVVAAEPLPLADRFDAFNAGNLLLVAERQVDVEADRGLHQQAIGSRCIDRARQAGGDGLQDRDQKDSYRDGANRQQRTHRVADDVAPEKFPRHGLVPRCSVVVFDAAKLALVEVDRLLRVRSSLRVVRDHQDGLL